MFHACVQRFDGMDEKILGEELNRAIDQADLPHPPSIVRPCLVPKNFGKSTL